MKIKDLIDKLSKLNPETVLNIQDSDYECYDINEITEDGLIWIDRE